MLALIVAMHFREMALDGIVVSRFRGQFRRNVMIPPTAKSSPSKCTSSRLESFECVLLGADNLLVLAMSFIPGQSTASGYHDSKSIEFFRHPTFVHLSNGVNTAMLAKVCIDCS